MTRRFVHLLLLCLLAGLPTLAAFTNVPRALYSSPLFGGDAPRAMAAEQVELPAMPPVSGSSSAQASDARPPDAAAPAASPVAAAPSGVTAPVARPAVQWVESFRQAVLWASEQANAASVGEVDQWTRFRVTGPTVNGRLPVEYPGDGVSRLPRRGWINGSDIGPSGPPNPDVELAAGGDVSPLSGVAVPRRIVQAWPQGISAQYAALIDGDSGEILWGRNAHGRIAPASLTKIVTSLVALERARLTDRVPIRVDSRTMYESTVMGLTPGENLSMETLLFGLMLPSGNDAAVAIAQQVTGSERAFAELMNAKAAQLGLVDSHFVNPHGLDADGHYSSPYDLCMFSRVGMRDPVFARLAGTRHYDGEGYSLDNLNRLLALYPKADGVKVGYTDNAGRAIVASATQNGHRLYVALLRSNNPTPEAQALLEWGFQGFVWP